MFFKEIYGMLTDGTELGMNIRRTGGGLAVSVMPKSRDGGESARLMVPLVASGTPEELDGGLLAAIAKPLAKATGLIMNIAEFERQAAKAAERAKSKVPAVKETKEEREKREKLERTLKRADEAAAARRFAESLALLKHVLAAAPSERQEEIKARMQEVRRKAEEGSLFAMQPGQPQVHASQQHPTPQHAQPAAAPNTVRGAAAVQGPQAEPVVLAPTPQPSPYAVPQQPAVQPRPPYGNANGQASVAGPLDGGYGNVHTGNLWQHVTETETETYGEEEDDAERFRNDPYAEYLDFPQECRMRDEAQAEALFQQEREY